MVVEFRICLIISILVSCLDGACSCTYVDWKFLSYAIVILEPDICMAAKQSVDCD